MRDKTRKIIWGRSGNRCAICRKELVINANNADEESIIGEECHIISGQENGPRYDASFPTDQLDEPENLILLCRVHHKIVDDQCETYTVEYLQKIKQKHELWVTSSLEKDEESQPYRFRLIKKNIPKHLHLIKSGTYLMNLIGGAYSYQFDHDEPNTEEELELISQFLQLSQDWGDLWADYEAGERVRITFNMNNSLLELENAGFLVFGALEINMLEGGGSPPSSWPIAVIRVVRNTNPEIIKSDINATIKTNINDIKT